MRYFQPPRAKRVVSCHQIFVFGMLGLLLIKLLLSMWLTASQTPLNRLKSASICRVSNLGTNNINALSALNDLTEPSEDIQHHVQGDCPWCFGQGSHLVNAKSADIFYLSRISKRCFGLDYADAALIDAQLSWFAQLSHSPPLFFSIV